MATFPFQPGYNGSWDQNQTGSFQGINGLTGQGAMVGGDGLTYINIWVSLVGFPPKNVFCLAASDGSFYNYTNEDIADLFGESSDHFKSACVTGKMVLPLAGTSDFWFMVADSVPFPPPGIGSRFVYKARRFRIVDGNTLVSQAYWEADFGTGPTGNTSLTNDDSLYCFCFNASTGVTRFMSSITVQSKMLYADIPYGGGVGDFTFFVDAPNMDLHFWEFIGSGSSTAFAGCAAMGYNAADFFILYYVNALSLEYIQDNPTVSAHWGHITETGVYKYDFAGHSGPLAGLDLSDAQKKLDGSDTTASRPSADSPIDDYTSINLWNRVDGQYLVMARTYVDQADIATTGHGSIGRVRVWQYSPDTGVGSEVFDQTDALYDTVSDLGVSSGNRNTYPINWLTTGATPDGGFCIIAGRPSFEGNHSHNPTIVLCTLFGGEGIFHSGFAAFTDPGYLDWGATDFTSYLDTWHMSQDDTALWMEAPWVITYLDNTDGTPSCFMTPRWEWTESLAVHKSGPPAQLYIARPGATVSDRRNRVRGKGRALRLHFESETAKPFNLLGWSIDFDRNANY